MPAAALWARAIHFSLKRSADSLPPPTQGPAHHERVNRARSWTGQTREVLASRDMPEMVVEGSLCL